MQRMRNDTGRIFSVLVLLALGGFDASVRGELIRPRNVRSYPDIAGDIVGEQTYSFDAASQTGVFRVTNAPHVITLEPGGRKMVDLMPDLEGTLNETLQLRLDRDGKLVDQPDNRFELRGSVTIGGKFYEGLLLEGRPTAFGARSRNGGASQDPEVFDLNMKVTGGKLAEAFGSEAYFRITPQENSTFRGDFSADFSGEKPLTSLRASRKDEPIPVPEPTSLFLFLACGAGAAIGSRLRRRGRSRGRSALGSVSRRGATQTTSRALRSRSGGPALSSGRATRRSL